MVLLNNLAEYLLIEYISKLYRYLNFKKLYHHINILAVFH